MRRVVDRIRWRWLLSLAFAAAASGCDLGDDPEREPAGGEPRNGSQRDPAAAAGAEPRPLAERLRRGGYAVYVDEADLVWVTDFGADALVRFDPATERFQNFRLHSPGASVRQLLGREGELRGAESGADRLVVARWR